MSQENPTPQIKKPYFVTSEPAKQIIITSAAQVFSAFVAAGKLTETNQKELVAKSVQIAIDLTQEVIESVKSVSR